MTEDAPAPSFKEVVIRRLKVEALELALLASMLESDHVGSARELREDYIPDRIRALEEIGTRGKGEEAS